MDQLISPTRERPEQAQFLNETLEALHMAIRALSDPQAHIWPTLLHLLAFTRRLEIAQDLTDLTPAQQTVQLLRVIDENDGLRRELQQLVGKLAARSVTRAFHADQLAEIDGNGGQPSSSIGPFDPEMEPWLAAMITRSIPD